MLHCNQRDVDDDFGGLGKALNSVKGGNRMCDEFFTLKNFKLINTHLDFIGSFLMKQLPRYFGLHSLWLTYEK